MFISIDDCLYNKCIQKCESTKFKKSTLHYKDHNKVDKKIKVICSNNRLYHYTPQLIYSKEIIPRSMLLDKICTTIQTLLKDISII